MSRKEDTSIGGDQRGFETTHWTAIEQVRAGPPVQAQELVGELLQSYWKPVYRYLRHRGYDNEEAKDLTQDFFQEVVLGRELVQRADRAKGRFRTLLLRALDRYLVSVHRRETARKRVPRGRLVPLSEKNLQELPPAIEQVSSEAAFNYAWVTELLDRMLADVKAQCLREGMAVHWDLFHDRVLRPILEDRPPPPLTELCGAHGIEEVPKASNMIFAVKRRFQSALKRHLRQSVACDGNIEEEARELLQFLDRRRQYRT
jgi:DNA-directed RNA polymerase specialized sigma24 family protein